MIEVVAKYLIDKSDITSSKLHSKATKTSQNSSTTFTDHVGRAISGENPMVRVGIASQKSPSAAETRQSQSVHPHSVLPGDSSQKPVTQTGSSGLTRRGQESRWHGFKPRGITEWESDQERSFGDQQPAGKTEAPNINKTTTDVAGERTKGKHTGFAAEKVESKPETGAKVIVRVIRVLIVMPGVMGSWSMPLVLCNGCRLSIAVTCATIAKKQVFCRVINSHKNIYQKNLKVFFKVLGYDVANFHCFCSLFCRAQFWETYCVKIWRIWI